MCRQVGRRRVPHKDGIKHQQFKSAHRDMKKEQCELCGSKDEKLNFHHLIPRTFHSNKWYRKNYTIEYMKSNGIWICENTCHSEIHKFISEKEMGRLYNTFEKLMEHPKVKKYVDWKSKK